MTVPALPEMEPVMSELNVLELVNVFAVYVFGMVDEPCMYELTPEEKSETWELVILSPVSVVRLGSVVVAERTCIAVVDARVSVK